MTLLKELFRTDSLLVEAETDHRKKPTSTPKADNPAAYSIADNLFWNDIMMEHAIFFQSLMPGPELDKHRKKAEEFQRLFEQQLERSNGRNAKDDDYIGFNRGTISLVKRFSDYKKEMQQLQSSGKIRSLVWPLFFEHTAREADRFISRLELYNRKQIEFELSEVVDFWSKTMGEHSAFIAHLLDPEEEDLIKQAIKMKEIFLGQGFSKKSSSAVMKTANDMLGFKKAGEKGIYAGKIKSIIPPQLASHVRRESMKFVDELKRT